MSDTWTDDDLHYIQALSYAWAYNDHCCPPNGPHVDSTAFANHWAYRVRYGTHMGIREAFAEWVEGWQRMRALTADGTVGGVR